MQKDGTDVVDRVIEQWRAVLPVVATSRLAAAKRLQLAAARLEDRTREVLSALELEAGEFDVLAALLRQGTPYELAPSVLAREALVSTSGMTKRLDRLERRRVIARRPDPDDRRAVLVGLTDQGVALAVQAVPLQAAALEQAFAAFDDDALEDIARLLRPLV